VLIVDIILNVFKIFMNAMDGNLNMFMLKISQIKIFSLTLT